MIPRDLLPGRNKYKSDFEPNKNFKRTTNKYTTKAMTRKHNRRNGGVGAGGVAHDTSSTTSTTVKSFKQDDVAEKITDHHFERQDSKLDTAVDNPSPATHGQQLQQQQTPSPLSSSQSSDSHGNNFTAKDTSETIMIKKSKSSKGKGGTQSQVNVAFEYLNIAITALIMGILLRIVVDVTSK
jgi:hypothetical protein